MNVPFQLRRLPTRLPATALLLPGHEIGPLLDLCARLRPMPSIYPVADGFLLKLQESISEPCPGMIRLRELARDLFVPADAELLPALHEDECTGLTRDQGLVFLPGGRALAFAPDQPLALFRILTLGSLRRDDWKPLPAPRQFAQRIHCFLREVPEPSADEILGLGGRRSEPPGEPAEGLPRSGADGTKADDIATEEPRPEDSGMAAKCAGRIGLAAGKVMIGLGQLLHWKVLSNVGAGLINQALALAPRLSESILGRQEAALRALLRLFHQGDVERALRRAVPLASPQDRGAVPLGGHQLPINKLLYSLANILGIDRGMTNLWLGGGDVWPKLQQEYRKAAEQAAQQGDYRRAALIYGKLLRDYRSAANALAQGGTFRDAAILYLDKLGDKLAAARMYEEAGEIDRAVVLYRQTGDHALVGDALRRAGEPEAALAEYQLAAAQLVNTYQDYHAAGELLLRRAGNVPLAQAYFEAGWARRPGPNDIPCAKHLLALYAQQPSPQALLQLVAEAEERLGSPGDAQAASQFFNEVAVAAESPKLASVRDDLRDRARLALAAKVRQQSAGGARPGDLAWTFFGPSGAWKPAEISDAAFAIKHAIRGQRPSGQRAREPVISRTQLRQGVVTAACFAPASGDVFLGYEDGSLMCFRAETGKAVHLPTDYSTQVTSLATAPDGHLVVALHDVAQDRDELTSYLLTPQRDWIGSKQVWGQGNFWLVAVVTWSRLDLVGVGAGQYLHFLRGARLIHNGGLALPEEEASWCSGLILPSLKELSPSSMAILLFGHHAVWYCEGPQREGRRWTTAAWHRATLGWTPGIPAESPCAYPCISWLRQDVERLELAGVDNNGTIHWSQLCLKPDHVKMVSTQASVRPEGYQAAAIVRPGFIAGVSRSHIDWLRSGPTTFILESAMRASLPHAVACFPCSLTNELIVVCRDGVVARVLVPK